MSLIQFANTVENNSLEIDSSEWFSYIEAAISNSETELPEGILAELEQLKKLSSVLTMETVRTGDSEYMAALFTISEPAIAAASSIFYMGMTCARLMAENNLKLITVSTEN